MLRSIVSTRSQKLFFTPVTMMGKRRYAEKSAFESKKIDVIPVRDQGVGSNTADREQKATRREENEHSAAVTEAQRAKERVTESFKMKYTSDNNPDLTTDGNGNVKLEKNSTENLQKARDATKNAYRTDETS
mmetsp:Transcript_3169/g.3901  ORF Transcript_3169/g.3901 Transcript_3169/m.3901 type:complete len:132 (+) Transcript_3169:840-1235(+)